MNKNRDYLYDLQVGCAIGILIIGLFLIVGYIYLWYIGAFDLSLLVI